MDVDVDVVVAHYSEDASWLAFVDARLRAAVRGAVRIYVYTKGPPGACMGVPCACARVEALPNVGRESHTYLHHMAALHAEYAAPAARPRYVVFAQGAIRDHAGGMHEEDFVHALLRDAAARGGASLATAQTHARYTAPEHAALPGFTIATHHGRPVAERAGCSLGEWLAAHVLLPGQGWPSLPGDGGHLRWWRGAVFCVSAALLAAARPRASYEALLRLVAGSADPEAGHFFERSWVYVTGAHALLQHGSPDSL